MDRANSHYNEGRHRSGLRGLDKVSSGAFARAGRFGRLFRSLPPHAANEADLIALGQAMTEAVAGDPAGNNPAIPAGFTYLGQFIDHDITFDTTALSEQPRDPDAVVNFRTPQLELDSVYGIGPAGSPHLYERDNTGRFVIGGAQASADGAGIAIPALPNDLPRMAQTGFAVIGDPRNDENIVVAQTHLAFLKFHNKIVDREGVGFDEARRLVRWHYQWIVLHDFLRRITKPAIFDRVMDLGRQHYFFPDNQPFIPVEFAVAAYRFGHSMVRNSYNYNRVFGFRAGAITPATLALLFRFTGLSGDGSNVPIPSNWVIDWRDFHEISGAPQAPGLSRKINPLLAEELQNVPGLGSLAAANLARGLDRGLPSGQAVARKLLFTPLPPAAFDGAAPHPDSVARDLGFDVETPLWYYILKEAEIEGGAHLGDVGSLIVAEVFLGLLEGDSESYLRQDPNWTPTLGPTPGDFSMAHLLEYVGEINPIGD